MFKFRNLSVCVVILTIVCVFGSGSGYAQSSLLQNDPQNLRQLLLEKVQQKPMLCIRVQGYAANEIWAALMSSNMKFDNFGVTTNPSFATYILDLVSTISQTDDKQSGIFIPIIINGNNTAYGGYGQGGYGNVGIAGYGGYGGYGSGGYGQGGYGSTSGSIGSVGSNNRKITFKYVITGWITKAYSGERIWSVGKECDGYSSIVMSQFNFLGIISNSKTSLDKPQEGINQAFAKLLPVLKQAR